MKKFVKAIILAAALCIFLAPLEPSNAAEATSIGIVDVQKLVTESKAGKDIQSQMERQKSDFLAEISKQEQKLRDDEKKLSNERATISQEEFAKKAKAFEANLADTRRKAQEHKKNLEAGVNGALKTLRDEITKVVDQIAEEKKFDLVLNSQNVIISNKSFDITEEALARLDKKISQIPLNTGQN